MADRKENAELIAEVEHVIEAEREIAVNSPMPTPESAEGGVFCENGCHEIKPKYGVPKVKKGTGSFKETEAAVHLNEDEYIRKCTMSVTAARCRSFPVRSRALCFGRISGPDEKRPEPGSDPKESESLD